MSQANQRVQLEIPKRSYRDILGQEIDAAWTELKRPDAGLFLSGVSAGMDVGFSLLVMAVTLTLADGSLTPLVQRLLLAAMYSVGFVFVNLGRSELFTEHTMLMMFPVLSGGVTLRALARVWLWVYAGNLLGAAAFALLAARFAPILGIIQPRSASPACITALLGALKCWPASSLAKAFQWPTTDDFFCGAPWETSWAAPSSPRSSTPTPTWPNDCRWTRSRLSNRDAKATATSSYAHRSPTNVQLQHLALNFDRSNQRPDLLHGKLVQIAPG